MLKLPSFNQDRLGTNIGNALEKEMRVSQGKGFPANGSKNFWQRFPDSAQAPLTKAGDGGIWRLSTAPSGTCSGEYICKRL
jgi:hypothetical protein